MLLELETELSFSILCVMHVKSSYAERQLVPLRCLTSKMCNAEMLRKTSSPKDKFLFGQREQIRSPFPGK
ncbi:hypothetical protein Goshw_008713 [Gossypium schwendimanii]|uniref:Uncharacterized protein n=1 Tax=Gossypium schwendimanii TaxID=34291 RepID=A0A7J9LET5_GOSSC|nr:hypothetical protein [Gossypium schwendimanii]